MDNITHSLVGVALADLAMGSRGTKAQRPLFVGAGIIAANLPDIDLAYSRITPMPLGYLLHHRGHTHTVAGLAVLAVILIAAYWFFPAVRKLRLASRVRFWLLIAIALASHLALDGLNSYGIHPLYPWDASWFFGDTVFIMEPWLWLILGIAVAWNAGSRRTRIAAALMLILLCAIASTGIISITAAASLAIAGTVAARMALRLTPWSRTAAALVMCAVVIAVLAGGSRLARSATLDALGRQVRGQVVDVIVTPNPSSILCWAVIAIEKRESEGTYVMWRGTLSLAPGWRAPMVCASQRFAGAGNTRIVDEQGRGRLALQDTIRQPLSQLRVLAAQDCWARAWLRFGRAPVIDDGWIYDWRFGIGQDFTRMRLAQQGCPANVPGWAMPRADLLISR